jgi:hypothetical protein
VFYTLLTSVLGKYPTEYLSQSTHNLENDTAELKVMMARLLESNAALAMRMPFLETAQMKFVSLREDHGSASPLAEWLASTFRTEDADPITFGAAQYPTESAFEEDLIKSWVYQRSFVRGPRTFSIATSTRLTQVTQSWSILSGLSLSNISNIAVQSLPVYAEDLKTNHLYSFEGDDASFKTKWHTYLEERGASPPLRKRAAMSPLLPVLSGTTPFDFHTTQDSQGEDKISEIREESFTNTDFLPPSFHFP